LKIIFLKQKTKLTVLTGARIKDKQWIISSLGKRSTQNKLYKSRLKVKKIRANIKKKLQKTVLLACQQEAQLSQRDRAMLHVIEDFVKSLKIAQGHLK